MTAQPSATLAATVMLGLLAAAVVARPAPAGAQPSSGGRTTPNFRAPEGPTRMFTIDFGRRLIDVRFRTTHLFELHGESGDFKTRYDAQEALAWNAGLAWRLDHRRLGGHLGFGLEASLLDKPMAAELEARVPHPYVLSFPREIKTRVRGLRRREVGIHFFQGQYWRTLTDRLLLRVFAGPTIFMARQHVVTRIDTGDFQPTFDRAFLRGYEHSTAKALKLGYNIGFDVTWLASDRVGLAGAVRYSRASITSHEIPRTPVPFALGGPNVGGGLRLRF